jgi:hypothetical protein
MIRFVVLVVHWVLHTMLGQVLCIPGVRSRRRTLLTTLILEVLILVLGMRLVMSRVAVRCVRRLLSQGPEPIFNVRRLLRARTRAGLESCRFPSLTPGQPPFEEQTTDSLGLLASRLTRHVFPHDLRHSNNAQRRYHPSLGVCVSMRVVWRTDA